MSDCSNPDIYDDGTSDGWAVEDPMATATTMSMDIDGDGYAETTAIDFDTDGVADAFESYDPTTGVTHITLDTDGDGSLDTVVSDFDGDGSLDVASSDTDGDGVLDTSYDPNTGEELDPTTGEPVSTPFDTTDTDTGDDDGEDTDDTVIVDDGTADPTDPFDTDDDGVHGDPMEDIEYHQAQVGPNDCLPTSVAMVLTEVLGDEVPQSEVVDLANELGLLGPTGMSVEGGVALLEHWDVDATVETGSMDDLRAMLDAEKPVIIGLDSDDLYGQGDAPFSDDFVAGHAVVITGIDDEQGLVYINDPGFPDGAGVAIPIEQFEDAWTDADHTMIAVETGGTDMTSASTDDTDAGSAGNVDTADHSGQGLGRLVDLILMPFNLKI